jgi:predicted nucleic acid-binding protein
MSGVLVDSSVWIEYFKKRNSPISVELDLLIDSGDICLNDLVLAELVPSLRARKQSELIDILQSLERFPLRIDWDEIISLQTKNLRHGINKVGIPDLMILQNALQNNASLFTLDKHFRLMQGLVKFRLHGKGHFA